MNDSKWVNQAPNTMFKAKNKDSGEMDVWNLLNVTNAFLTNVSILYHLLEGRKSEH